MSAFWPVQPSGTETEATATGASHAPDINTSQREEAVSWVAGQLGDGEHASAGASGQIPPWLAEMAGSGEDITDGASGTGLTSPREALDTVVNQNLDAYELANVVNESNPGRQTPVEQISTEIQALPLVAEDQTDNAPTITADANDSELYLRTQPADNIQLSQLTTSGSLQTVLRNPGLYGTQNVLIALHACLLKQYLKLRDSGGLSEPQTNEYRRSISHLVMVIHTISQYSQSEISAQREQVGLNNWIENRYVNEVFESFSQSVNNPGRPFTADHLNDGLRMAFGIIQYFRSFIIARRVEEQVTASDPESRAELDQDAHTVETVTRLDSLANLLVPDSDMPLSSLAYARNNVFPHTNAILANHFWLRANTIHRRLNNFQRWHILNEMHVALQLVVLGQNEQALSLIRGLNDTYELQEVDEHNPLPSASNVNYESIVRWVFRMARSVLDFLDESVATSKTSGDSLRNLFFVSVYALDIYTETPDHARGRSDHQISRINTEVLDFLYTLLLTPKTGTEIDIYSESETESGATFYLDSRYANFLRARHKRHKMALAGNIQAGAERRLKARSNGQ
ncbi:hypothetical protein [Endozoicomonas euniceicola]|uniref:Uncharacterized protein n=1 Tax=Endozoicomonas euniceicola TaxID=1234143 RepID=A0ABY6H0B1_9GAMM|nr:hypothetical protein [Endozoicomonas euniceicola]UYM17599.1 hypothetical protein NX720_06755 [Endozoicomonas euniceicola]